MRRFARVSSFVCLALLFVLQSALAAPQQERRLALVIGNSAYKSAPLKNPVNDARDMYAALKTLGFEATLLTDATMQQMEDAVREFGLALRQGGLGLFYYAGHGVQVGGNNYLVPVNAVIQSESDVKYGCLDAGLVLGKMEDAGNGLNLVILDACRNNPFARSFRSAEQGLAKMDAPTGSLIAYATSPGRTAADGEGKNGLYTQHLLRNINTPGLSVEELFKRVRQGVAMDSAKKQVPWEASSLIGQFSFAGGVQTASLGAPPPPRPAPVSASATPVAPAPAQLAQAEPKPQLAPAPTPEETKLIEAMREKGGRELVLKLAKPLAARGSIYGRFALGWLSEGKMERNQAVTLAANQGIPLAMVHLAEFLANHPLSPEDGAEARMWLRKAIALGEPDAKYSLGAMLIEGKGGPRDVAAGERLFSEAARERPFFYTAIGDYYWEEAAGKTLPKAQADAKGLAYFQRAIDLGDTYAMTSLAGAYRSGEHVAENEKEAERLYTLAANTGDSNDMYYLGKFLAHKNKPLAARWYKKAAQLGNAYAAAALGRMCRDGEGIPKDIPQALALFRGAAEQGDGESQHELGQMYEQGLGVPKSIPQAYYWYVLSGELWGKHELERLDAQLAPAERVKIKAQAAKWKPRKDK
jgi:TPR repeat protein